MPKDEGQLFGKKFHTHIIEIEYSKKKFWKFLKVIMRKILSFGKAFYLTKIDGKLEDDTITRQNQVIKTKEKCSISKQRECKYQEAPSCMSSTNGKYFFYSSKGSFCHQQFRTGSTNKDCNSRAGASNNKKIIYKKHSKYTISRRLAYFIAAWEEITQDHKTYCKRVQNTVCKSPISGENIRLDKNDKTIIFISGARSFRNVGGQNYPKSSTYARASS